MAKGVEDTTFYTYNRLVALNEVGGNPGRFGVSPEEFHHENELHRPHTGRHAPGHVDARHQAVARTPGPGSPSCRRSRAGSPGRWPSGRGSASGTAPTVAPRPQRRVAALPDAGRRLAAVGRAGRGLHGEGLEGGQGAHQLGRPRPRLRRRPARLRRGRRWPTTSSPPPSRRSSPRWSEPGRVNSLAQTLLQADVARACPTSTRAASCGTTPWSTPTTAARSTSPSGHRCWPRPSRPPPPRCGPGQADSGLPKLLLTHRALHLRRRRQECFCVGAAYEPLTATGPRAAHAVAYVRGGDIVAVAPRLVLRTGRRLGRHHADAARRPLRGRPRRATGVLAGRRPVRRPPRAAERRFPAFGFRRWSGTRRAMTVFSGVGAQGDGAGRPRAAGRGPPGRDGAGGAAGVVGGRRARGRAGDGLPVLARRRAGVSRSPVGVPAGRGARAVPASSTMAPSSGRTDLWRGAAPLSGALDLRGARRHVHAGGDVRGGDREAAPPRRARRHPSRAAAGGRVPRRAGLGVRRRRPVRPPPRLRRPRRAQAARRRRPRRRARRDHRRRLQPPRARRELPRRLRALLHRAATTRRGARRSTSTTPAATRSATFVCDNACHVAARLPRRRSAPRRRPRHRRHVRRPHPRGDGPPGARRCEAEPRAGASSSSPRATSTTPSWSAARRPAATASTPPGATTSTTPSTPP